MEIQENKYNVLLVDDHQMFLDGLNFMLSKESYLNIIGEANNGKNALTLIKNQAIDLVITDVNMPEMDGIELTRTIKEKYPATKVLVLTMHNDREIVSEIMITEAEGYVLKNCRKQELIDGIKTILDEGTFYCKEVAALVREKLKYASVSEKTELTEREREILLLILEEFSSKEIADKLSISKRTVDTHRIHIMEKTRTRTLVGLIKYAIQHQILE